MNLELGAVYTPRFLADYLALKILEIHQRDNSAKSVLICDPACGEGSLLSAIAERCLREKINPSLVGFDIDNDAVNKSVSNLSQYSSVRIQNKNALQPINGKSLLDGWREIQEEIGFFDLIIANPPWGVIIDSPLHDNLHKLLNSAIGQYDSYDVFFELCIRIAKKKCVIGFLIPDSIFAKEHMKLREFLAKQTQLELIARLGERIFPNINRGVVLIVVTKVVPPKNHRIKVFKLDTKMKNQVLRSEICLLEAEKALSHTIDQRRILSDKYYHFDIDVEDTDLKIIIKIRNSNKMLGSCLTSTRGIEISKRGIVCQCSVCEMWFPVPNKAITTCPHCKLKVITNQLVQDRIIHRSKHANSLPLLTGESIIRYQIKQDTYIELNRNGINYKNLNIYTSPKLLIRKTGVGVMAAIDYNDCLTNQVVYIFKLLDKPYLDLPLEFYLGLINSRLMYYYLIKTYGESEWRSHPYLTQSQILTFPIPNTSVINIKIGRLIGELVKKQNPLQGITNQADAEIEYLVAKMFGIDKSDYLVIYNSIDRAQELIPVLELKRIKLSDIFSNHILRKYHGI